MAGEHDPRVLVLQELRKQTALLGAILLNLQGVRGTAPSDAVPDALLNGPHGDPIIKAKDPRDWAGEPMTGRHFSECPPEYLDLLAERFDYFASKPDQEAAKIRYAQLDAKRARGWAAKIRGGWVPPVAPPVTRQEEPAW